MVNGDLVSGYWLMVFGWFGPPEAGSRFQVQGSKFEVQVFTGRSCTACTVRVLYFRATKFTLSTCVDGDVGAERAQCLVDWLLVSGFWLMVGG